MKYLVSCAVASMALAAGTAQAEIYNGDFAGGNANWNVFGGAGIYDYAGNAAVPFESMAAATWGAFDGNGYSGVAQDISGGWSEGDTINFGAQAFVENPLFADNIGFVALNFFGADGNWWFNVVSDNVTNALNDGGIHDMAGSITLDAGAASAARIEFVIIFHQPWHDGSDSGAIIWDNAYANVVPTPGALALLGLAGLAGRRRRA
ncbi:MAG: hypothetical protein MK085_05880 [Phycisphaerales bacterium]|nr:hypothetical protein [Phycisphaerales bacterium]